MLYSWVDVSEIRLYIYIYRPSTFSRVKYTNQILFLLGKITTYRLKPDIIMFVLVLLFYVAISIRCIYKTNSTYYTEQTSRKEHTNKAKQTLLLLLLLLLLLFYFDFFCNYSILNSHFFSM